VCCYACIYRDVFTGDASHWEEACSPWFQLPLLLATDTAMGEIWVYNNRHLAQLRCYVAATLRDEHRCGNGSWSSCLPAWIKSAKNRGKVLKALDKLDQIAMESGLG